MRFRVKYYIIEETKVVGVMSDNFTIKNDIKIELVEKRSRFITGLYVVDSVNKAAEIIKAVKEREKGSSHNCHAYRILKGTTVIESRSDDGEPSGTAGAPMLAVLSGAFLVNTLAITTRYFGGTKLGTGGLVKVYTDGVKTAIESAEKVPLLDKESISIKFRINDTTKVNYVLKKYNIDITEKIFTTPVEYILSLTGEQKDAVFKELDSVILR